MKKILPLLLCCLLSAFSYSQSNSTENFLQKLRLCKLEGIKDSVLCGTFPVHENREMNQGRLINLNIIVIPALNKEKVPAPIFYIEGGPGVAASHSTGFWADSSNPYHPNYDIVLIDVRGTGKSNPLHCLSLQQHTGLQQQLDDMYPPHAVTQCYDSLSKIADLTQYTTVNVVKDLEDVRKWLGYEQVNIFGLSYGTRVCLVYMKMFPSSIRSTVLWSPVPTYGRMPMYHAKFAQNVLQQLIDSCKNDAACNKLIPSFQKEFNELMARGRKNPFTTTYKNKNGKTEQLKISWDVFQTKLRTLMYTPAGLRQIPFIIHEAWTGNFQPFLKLYRKENITDLFLAEGFYLCVTCTEDVPFIFKDQVESLTKQTFMGTYRIDQQVKACELWTKGKIPGDYLDTIHSNIPTLILSGTLDPVTPVSMAKEISSHLPNSRLVIFPQMAHSFDGLNNIECFDEIVLHFIADPIEPKWNLDCINSMSPPKYKVKD